MTAKEKLRQTVEKLSEEEAQNALRYFDERERRDALTEFLENAPEDDEAVTPDEEEGVREAKAEIARGDVFSAKDIKRELG